MNTGLLNLATVLLCIVIVTLSVVIRVDIRRQEKEAMLRREAVARENAYQEMMYGWPPGTSCPEAVARGDMQLQHGHRPDPSWFCG